MTLAERRQREKEQRCETILNAAEKLFFTRDYDNVSMDEIAEEAELSKPAVYYYFKNKKSLFFAVVNRGIKIGRAMIEEEVNNAQTNGLKIGATNLAAAKFGLEYPDYAKAMTYCWSGKFDLWNEKDTNPEAKKIIEFAEECNERTFSIVKNGIEDGTFRSDVNPILVVVLNTVISSGVMQMSPLLRMGMEAYGITVEQFNLEVADLAYRMVMKIEEVDENIRAKKLKQGGDSFAAEQNKS